jgi:hypothetical protein
MSECENVENGFPVCPLVTELQAENAQLERDKAAYRLFNDSRLTDIEALQAENANLLDILKRLMSEFDEPDEYMTVFQEAQVALEGNNNENKT